MGLSEEGLAYGRVRNENFFGGGSGEVVRDLKASKNGLTLSLHEVYLKKKKIF